MNMSWYKNTWLGKKLGCKIDWNTENLVHKDNTHDKVRVLFELDGELYIGFRKYISLQYDKSNTLVNVIVDEKEIISKDYIKLDEWKIEHDPTKVEALSRINKMEKDTRYKREVVNTWVEVKRTFCLETMADFKLSPEFYREASKYIIKEEIVPTVGNTYAYRLVCTTDNVSMLTYLYKKHMKQL